MKSRNHHALGIPKVRNYLYIINAATMKLLILSLLFIFALSCQKNLSSQEKKQQLFNEKVEIISPQFTAVSQSINGDISGFYIAKPQLYDSTSKTYPLLISIHGGEQIGNGSTDLPLLLKEGIPKLVSQGKFPASFNS